MKEQEKGAEMSYKFAFTIGAIKDVCERCPDHDIARIDELFSDDYYTTLNNMIWFITTLNRWAVFKETRSFDGALSEEDIMVMDMDEIKELFADAMKTFRNDSTPETEVEPTKKAEAVPKTKS